MRIVSMSANGRLTLPADARRQLGLEGEAHFQVEVNDDESLTLRPVVVVRRDAWAYTPEHLARIAKAEADLAEGRVHRLSDADLAAFDDDEGDE